MIEPEKPVEKTGEYLTASGGWVGPSITTTWSTSGHWGKPEAEILKELLEAREKYRLSSSLPEVKVDRGGIKFTRSDDA